MLKRLVEIAWISAALALVAWQISSGVDLSLYTPDTVAVFILTLAAGIAFSIWQTWKWYGPGKSVRAVVGDFASIAFLTSLFALMAFGAYAVPR